MLMEFLWSLIIVILLLVYNFAVSPKICRKKIYRQIESIGGQVTDIVKLTLRSELYSVSYVRNGAPQKVVIQFGLFYRSKWK